MKKPAIKYLLVALTSILCLLPAFCLAMEPMAATIKVSAGTVYDYALIGETRKATDGFDNAYDTMSPGGSLNSIYINTYFAHPEWGAAKKNFRGDIRALAEKQEWTLTIESTLPANTPLKVELQPGLNILPQGLQLTIRDSGNTINANLLTESLNIPAPFLALSALN